MKKYILLLLIVLASCASRHVKVDTIELKKDSVVKEKIVITTIEHAEKTDSVNISTNADDTELTITPIDTCKDIVVDGKHYKNVVLKIKKSKTNTLYTSKQKESYDKHKDSIATVEINKTEKVVGKNKVIDKKANYWTIFYWLILLLILYLLWKYRGRIFML